MATSEEEDEVAAKARQQQQDEDEGQRRRRRQEQEREKHYHYLGFRAKPESATVISNLLYPRSRLEDNDGNATAGGTVLFRPRFEQRHMMTILEHAVPGTFVDFGGYRGENLQIVLQDKETGQKYLQQCEETDCNMACVPAEAVKVHGLVKYRVFPSREFSYASLSSFELPGAPDGLDYPIRNGDYDDHLMYLEGSQYLMESNSANTAALSMSLEALLLANHVRTHKSSQSQQQQEKQQQQQQQRVQEQQQDSGLLPTDPLYSELTELKTWARSLPITVQVGIAPTPSTAEARTYWERQRHGSDTLPSLLEMEQYRAEWKTEFMQGVDTALQSLQDFQGNHGQFMLENYMYGLRDLFAPFVLSYYYCPPTTAMKSKFYGVQHPLQVLWDFGGLESDSRSSRPRWQSPSLWDDGPSTAVQQYCSRLFAGARTAASPAQQPVAALPLFSSKTTTITRTAASAEQSRVETVSVRLVGMPRTAPSSRILPLSIVQKAVFSDGYYFERDTTTLLQEHVGVQEATVIPSSICCRHGYTFMAFQWIPKRQRLQSSTTGLPKWYALELTDMPYSCSRYLCVEASSKPDNNRNSSNGGPVYLAHNYTLTEQDQRIADQQEIQQEDQLQAIQTALTVSGVMDEPDEDDGAAFDDFKYWYAIRQHIQPEIMRNALATPRLQCSTCGVTIPDTIAVEVLRMVEEKGRMFLNM